jgi:hypothetical protein
MKGVATSATIHVIDAGGREPRGAAQSGFFDELAAEPVGADDATGGSTGLRGAPVVDQLWGASRRSSTRRLFANVSLLPFSPAASVALPMPTAWIRRRSMPWRWTR